MAIHNIPVEVLFEDKSAEKLIKSLWTISEGAYGGIKGTVLGAITGLIINAAKKGEDKKTVAQRIYKKYNINPNNPKHAQKVKMVQSEIDKAYRQVRSKYEPPYPLHKLPLHLREDPVHRWRAGTGIELIHEEPTWAEFQRIRRNWELMTPTRKAISDIKSRELFGMDNLTHYKKLIVTMLLKD